MLAHETITILASRRQYEELEKRADEHIKKEGWEDLLRLLEKICSMISENKHLA